MGGRWSGRREPAVVKAVRRAVAKGRRDGVGTAWREEVEMMVCTGRIRRRMANMKSPKKIFECMQKDGYVLWNLEDTTDDKCGTIEFRGGRHSRGPGRTNRWISFAVCFIALALDGSWARFNLMILTRHSC